MLPRNGAPKEKIPPSDGHQPVAPGGVVGADAHDRLAQASATHGSVERSVAEREDPSVRGHQPVAETVGSGRDVHDRGIEVSATHGSVERSVAEREDPSVRRHQPVAADRPGWRRCA